MKLNISFLFLLLVWTFFSCSSDDTPGVEIPERVYDATLSLQIKENKKEIDTKADVNAGNVNSSISFFVNKLFLAVFDANGLVATSEVEAEQNSTNSKYDSALRIEDVKIPSGSLKVLLLANVDVPENLKQTNTSVAKYLELTGKLEDEKNGYLTMSSGVLEYSAAAGQNYIGIDAEDGFIINKDPIKLIRNVSNVYLEKLTLQPSANYQSSTPTKFTLKKIFMANVKNISSIASEDYWGKVEIEDKAISWWSGFTGKTGNLAVQNAIEKSFLCYDVVNAPKNKEEYNEKYPYLNGVWDLSLDNGGDILGKDKKIIIINPSEKIFWGYGIGFPLGVDFYVYENMESNYHTLLVIQGDYEYTPIGTNAPVTYEDRFYTVVVNKDGLSTDFNKVGEVIGTANVDHKYVKRNYKYVIYLTIAGPGSDNPYDKKADAHVSAQITVKNWDIVNMNEEVD